MHEWRVGHRGFYKGSKKLVNSDNIWNGHILSEEAPTVRVKPIVKWRSKDINNILVCRLFAKESFRHETELTQEEVFMFCRQESCRVGAA